MSKSKISGVVDLLLILNFLRRLTQSAFVLVSGRLGAIYGHQRLFLIGGAFIAVFSLVNAFCTSYNAFVAGKLAITYAM